MKGKCIDKGIQLHPWQYYSSKRFHKNVLNDNSIDQSHCGCQMLLDNIHS